MKTALRACILFLIACTPLGLMSQMTDLIFSEYGEGSGSNKYLELYNGTGEVLDLGQYAIWKITNAGFWYEREFVLAGALAHSQTYLIVHQNADSTLLARRDTVGPPGVNFPLFNGNEAFALVKITGPDTTDRVILDVIGYESGDSIPENWDVAGVEGAGAEHTWVRKPAVCGPNADWMSSAGTDSLNSEWIVYDQDYWDDAGMHTEECQPANPDVAADLFFSEYGEGSSDNKYLELFNGTGDVVDLGDYTIWKIINDGNWFEREFELTGMLADGDTYLIVNMDADSVLNSRMDTTGPVVPEFTLFNGNEAFALVKKTGPDSIDRMILDVIGYESGDSIPGPWDVAGVEDAGAEHTWVRKPTVCSPNADWMSSAGTDSLNSEWTVYDQDYWDDAGMHTFMIPATPTFTNPPEDTVLSCDMIPDTLPAIEVTYTAANGLEMTEMVSPYRLGSADECGGFLDFVYTFADRCGRSVSHIRRVTITPAELPYFVSPPADVTVEFDDIPDPVQLEVSNAGIVPGCPIADTVAAEVIDNSSPCGGSVIYVWSYTDTCGRTIMHTQVITVTGDGGIGTELFFSEYGEGSGDNKYLEIYNGTPNEVDLSNYTIWKIINDGNWFEREFVLEGTLGSCQTYLIVNKDADPELAARRDTTGPVDPEFTLFNGNEAFALVRITGPDSTDREILDVIGEESGDVSPDPWDVAGVNGAGAEHTWIRKPEICGPNPDWTSSAGTNADDSEWIVFEADYWDDAGRHTQECEPVVEAYASDLIISEYGEGSSLNKYMELYNGTGEDVDLSNYVMWKIINEGNWYERKFIPQGILAHGETFVMVNPDADLELFELRDTVGPVSPTFFLFNGNEAFALCKINAPGDTAIIDVIGVESGDVSPENWDVAGVVGAGAEHTWIRKPHICDPNPNWASSAGTDSINSEWIVIPADYWNDVGRHTQQCMPDVGGDSVAVTFQVDMGQEVVSPNGVHLAGSFNGFDAGATPMTDGNGDDVYDVTVMLAVNQSYEYRFVNGNDIGNAEIVPGECAQNQNRVVDVAESSIELPVVCFAACGSCSGTYNVTFRVDMQEQTVSADGVHVIGSFNSFDPAATPMTDDDADDVYEVTLELNGNTSYQYRFVNGNAFGFEENVPAECATNGNRTIMVETVDVSTEAYCFASCDVCEGSATIDVALGQSLSVVPNPNDGRFEVRFDIASQRHMEIALYDLTGRKLYRAYGEYGQGGHNVSLEIGQQGVFVLRLASRHGLVVRKVVVQ